MKQQLPRLVLLSLDSVEMGRKKSQIHNDYLLFFFQNQSFNFIFSLITLEHLNQDYSYNLENCHSFIYLVYAA